MYPQTDHDLIVKMCTTMQITADHKRTKAQNNKTTVSKPTDHTVCEDHNRCSAKIPKILYVRAHLQWYAAWTWVFLSISWLRSVTMQINQKQS